MLPQNLAYCKIKKKYYKIWQITFQKTEEGSPNHFLKLIWGNVEPVGPESTMGPATSRTCPVRTPYPGTESGDYSYWGSWLVASSKLWTALVLSVYLCCYNLFLVVPSMFTLVNYTLTHSEKLTCNCHVSVWLWVCIWLFFCASVNVLHMH